MSATELTITNSLSRRKEIFTPKREGEVRIYVCGPTVYGPPHFGHAKSYVSFDVVVRYLRFLGYNVLYVQNITDVGHLTDDADEGEDKILKQSRITKQHPMQVAEQYTWMYFRDMDALGVRRPDISPRATGHIPEMIDLIKRLMSRGAAYEVDGTIYFDVTSYPDYGKLSGRNLDDSKEGTRVEVRKEKRNPADFALWKKAEKGHIMQWESPWSIGYPGWHVECSAMSMKYLGMPFDIHGGGIDNQFPHHECEIAQSESGYGDTFARYWMHNNLVTVGGKKMGKSLENFVTLADAFKKFHPLAIRFFILQSHYRSTLDYTEEAVNASAQGYAKFMNTVQAIRASLPISKRPGLSSDAKEKAESFRKRLTDAMNDDFNAPIALGILFELAKEANILLAVDEPNGDDLVAFNDILQDFGTHVLGIIPEKVNDTGGSVSLHNELIELAIRLREEARREKMYNLSDVIRTQLEKMGIILEDKKSGTTWKFKP